MKASGLTPVIPMIILLFTFPAIAGDGPAETANRSQQPEIKALLSTTQIDQQQAAIRALVLRIGPEAAQEELLASGLPFTGQSHLIIHTVGSMIYKKFGPQGVGHCRPYFLGGCFHGFMIDAISERGPDAALDAWPACQKAGPSVPDQCAHAVGHGLLVWNKYSLTDALAACDTITARVSDMSAFNCYDGVFMEKVWKVHGHGHDHGAPQPQVAADLDYPCDDPQIQPKHLTACWGNQASVLYQAFHGDVAKVAAKCDSLKDPGSKEFCFNGLARQIHPLTNGNTDEAFRLCSKAITAGPWQDYCLITIAGSAFSVGDTANMPFQICNRIREGARTACYQRLFPLIHLYARGNLERADSFCARMNDPQAAEGCKQYQRNYAMPTATGPVTHQSATPVLKAALKPEPPLMAAANQSNEHTPPYQLPYASPYATPYATPYASPYYTPYASPYLDPYITPYINPYTDPYTTPYTDPYMSPYTDPYTTPYDTPYDTPYATPYDTPYDTPLVTPYVTPNPPNPPKPSTPPKPSKPPNPPNPPNPPSPPDSSNPPTPPGP